MPNRTSIRHRPPNTFDDAELVYAELIGVEKKVAHDLKFNQGIKAYRENAINAESGSIASLMGGARMISNRRTQVVVDTETFPYDFRYIMARTPGGRSAALSIYRGVQSHATG